MTPLRFGRNSISRGALWRWVGICCWWGALLACSGGGGGDDGSGPHPLGLHDYGIETFHINYRVFESDIPNYFTYVIIADNGEALQSENEVVAYQFIDSSGSDIPLSADSNFYSMRYIPYDCRSSPCSRSGPYAETGVWAAWNVLLLDRYEAQVEMQNGEILSATCDFRTLTVLPYVFSSSMQANRDNGDLELSWDNPLGPGWDEVDQLRIRIFDDRNNVVIQIRAPVTDRSDQSLTVPADLAAAAATLNGGAELKQWQIHTRAYDANDMNFARGYSDKVDLP